MTQKARLFRCEWGHLHREVSYGFPCLSTHGAAGGVSSGYCPLCHLNISNINWYTSIRYVTDELVGAQLGGD